MYIHWMVQNLEEVRGSMIQPWEWSGNIWRGYKVARFSLLERSYPRRNWL